MKRRNDGIDVQGKRPCFEFYPADWIRDLAPCSPVAKGVWVDLICHMHFARQRGYLETPAGAPFSEAQLSRMTGTTVRELRSALAELEGCSIFSRDGNGTIYNRRMVRDTDISRKRADAATKRLQDAERTDAGQFAPANEPAKEEQTGQQKTVLSPSPSSSSSSSPSGSNPLTPFVPADDFFEQRYEKHPRKGHKGSAMRAMAHVPGITTVEGQAAFAEMHDRHIASEEWRWKSGARAPFLDEWIIDEGYKYPPAEEANPVQDVMARYAERDRLEGLA